MSPRNRFSILIGIVLIIIGISSNTTFIGVGAAVLIIGIVRFLKERREMDDSGSDKEKD